MLLKHFRRDLLSFEVVYWHKRVVIIEIYKNVEDNLFYVYDISNTLDIMTAIEENLYQLA